MRTACWPPSRCARRCCRWPRRWRPHRRHNGGQRRSRPAASSTWSGARRTLSRLPDFAAVAADYDAVHVSVVAYLVTAGRAAPVDDAGTVLAGWDPDLTYWLTDTLTLAGPATDWVRLDQEPLGWSQERDQRN
jgi:hypothetical protein